MIPMEEPKKSGRRGSKSGSANSPEGQSGAVRSKFGFGLVTTTAMAAHFTGTKGQRPVREGIGRGVSSRCKQNRVRARRGKGDERKKKKNGERRKEVCAPASTAPAVGWRLIDQSISISHGSMGLPVPVTGDRLRICPLMARRGASWLGIIHKKARQTRDPRGEIQACQGCCRRGSAVGGRFRGSLFPGTNKLVS